jgi:hypothetical protein
MLSIKCPVSYLFLAVLSPLFICISLPGHQYPLYWAALAPYELGYDPEVKPIQKRQKLFWMRRVTRMDSI